MSTLQHPTHIYTTPGTYAVSLTVRLAGEAATWSGGTDTLTQAGYITVYEEYNIYLPLILRSFP